jgi:5'-nucleotidase
MPHESTVAHEQRFTMESPMIARSRTYSVLDQTVEEEEKPEVLVSRRVRIFRSHK